MDLNEAFEKVKVQVQKNTELKQEKDNAVSKLEDIIDANCREILLPEMNNLLQILLLVNGALEQKPAKITHEYYVDERNIRTVIQAGFVEVDYVSGNQWADIHYGNCCKTTGCRNTNAAAILSSVERTENLIEELRVQTAKYLEACLPMFDSENAELAKSVTELKGWLEQGGSVQRNEDGTVEISIGGKTYIGTVKEA